MISATEAKRITTEAKSNRLEQELRTIEDEIKIAIMDGKDTCYIDRDISPQAKDALQELGYTVSCGSQYNQSYVRISWR